MVSHLLLALLLQGAGAPSSRALTPRDSAFHALNRLAYGPRPGEVDSVARFGVMRWIEQQLDPGRISNAGLAKRERQFQLLDLSQDDLARPPLEAHSPRPNRLPAQSRARAVRAAP